MSTLGAAIVGEAKLLSLLGQFATAGIISCRSTDLSGGTGGSSESLIGGGGGGLLRQRL